MQIVKAERVRDVLGEGDAPRRASHAITSAATAKAIAAEDSAQESRATLSELRLRPPEFAGVREAEAFVD